MIHHAVTRVTVIPRPVKIIKIIFELIFFSTSIPRHAVMTGRLLWYHILLIFISKLFKFCHNRNILFILNLLKLDFQPSTSSQNENAHRRHSFGGLPFSNDRYTEISREKRGYFMTIQIIWRITDKVFDSSLMKAAWAPWSAPYIVCFFENE